MSESTQEPKINLDQEWVLGDYYDDGPITIDDPIVKYKTFNQVSWTRLKTMIERWPAMRKSWQAFIIDYNMCLATLLTEEDKDDIPF